MRRQNSILVKNYKKQSKRLESCMRRPNNSPDKKLNRPRSMSTKKFKMLRSTPINSTRKPPESTDKPNKRPNRQHKL